MALDREEFYLVDFVRLVLEVAMLTKSIPADHRLKARVILALFGIGQVLLALFEAPYHLLYWVILLSDGFCLPVTPL